MHIAGGLYREICLRPSWNSLFGSGGRAALAVAGLSNGPVLHSYFENNKNADLEIYRDEGIQLELAPRRAGIAFAYFHPLSKPHLEQSDPAACQPLQVEGDVVLRFGFVEGDAVVSARRAIFDPQGWRNPLDFYANGSVTDELALVLNEAELRKLDSTLSGDEAGRKLIRSGQANIVVVKRGVFGARVIDEALEAHDIPAFKSPHVFKIGTGDVFSALFALYWGEQGWKPEQAAYFASKGVASYTTTQRLPVENHISDHQAVIMKSMGAVLVIGLKNTIGQHYTFEEAMFRLRELGVDVRSHFDVSSDPTGSAILILADGMTKKMVRSALDDLVGLPVVLLDELQDPQLNGICHDVIKTTDFSTALYQVSWAAMNLNDPDGTTLN
ncbi:hypothetical protein A9Q95_14710 [Rhodobacterales bacterium 59_46_T64]|nr:hypothetical protein A9Q95_14710 [Rhodobacterales bacterium 59_46_T64]